jgi:hypothetical protein
MFVVSGGGSGSQLRREVTVECQGGYSRSEAAFATFGPSRSKRSWARLFAAIPSTILRLCAVRGTLFAR